MQSERPRVFFYSHDGHGLGHLRMTRLLAKEFVRRDPTATIMIATGAQSIDETTLPEQISVVKLPSMRSSAILGDLRPAVGSNYAWRGIWAIREALLHEAIRVFDPHLVVGDNEPAGMQGELARSLQLVRSQGRRASTVLGMNDCLGDGEATLRRWERDGGNFALAHDYDHVLIFGQPDVFDPRTDYAFPPEIAARTHFTGYLWQEPTLSDRSHLSQIRARYGINPNEPWIVIAAGGGEDGYQLLKTACETAQSGQIAAKMLLVTGPFMPDEQRADLSERVSQLPGVTVETSVADMPGHLAAADAVAILGGYNSVVEAIGAGHRPIIIPRDDSWTEQRIRAERLAELRLAICIRPIDLTVDRLELAMRDVLGAIVSPPRLLDLTGIQHAVHLLQEFLPPPSERWPVRSLAAISLPTPKRVSPQPPSPLPVSDRIVSAWDGTLFYVRRGDLIEEAIQEAGAFEFDVQRAIFPWLRPGDVVIDAGANIGCHTCPMAIRVGQFGAVIAIEPVGRLADRLDANCQLNGIANVILERRAISANAGHRTLNIQPIDEENQGEASFHRDLRPGGEKLQVETSTIDALVAKHELTSLRLIKLDLEGEDLAALLGARNTLQRFHPVIAFEYHPDLWKRAGRVLADADTFLSHELGYRLRPLWSRDDIRTIIATPNLHT